MLSLDSTTKKVSILESGWELLACMGRDGGQGGAAQGCSWCCGRPPSDGAGNSHCSRPQDCPISGLRNLFRAKKCRDMDHSRSEVLFFKFWTLTETAWCINDNWCQWWSSLARNRQVVLEQDGSLSKTTKLLLLDSLLQEVCIESGSTETAKKLLYPGLKKVH